MLHSSRFYAPGVTGICQPMDVSVMKTFKNQVTYVRNVYLQYHIDHPFPANPREKRALMSRIVAEAWGVIPAKVIVNGSIKAGLNPIGP
ncbi:hypothetical protein PHMEG_00031774, partial [Phytophthora megakarya]